MTKGSGPERQAALDALGRYREAGAATGGVECLLQRASVLERDAPSQRRRSELVERAQEGTAIDRAFAEQIYDTAHDEGLEPAFAFELVRCGVGVRLDPPEEADEAALQEGAPAWIAPETGDRDEVLRERRLRATFRRLRALLEQCGTPEQAHTIFVAEPDVGDVIW